VNGIFVEQHGHGPDLVLVHGWGLHGGVWDGVLSRLRKHWRVTVVDLPGHGRSTLDPSGMSLDDVAGRLLELVPRAATWLGWSLGSLVALAAAGREGGPGRLVLVAGTPRFAQAGDWSAGMDPATLQGFADELQRDYEGTLRRFLGLHVGAGADSRQTIRELRGRLFAHGRPSARALSRGLRWLRDTDLRARVPRIEVPTVLIHGSHDRLVPAAAARWLAENLDEARLHIVDGAGHAPFLSHGEVFVDVLNTALDTESQDHAG
jgi:pimeloyl-[acyl-carrier protein] methyl ester esterase